VKNNINFDKIWLIFYKLIDCLFKVLLLKQHKKQLIIGRIYFCYIFLMRKNFIVIIEKETIDSQKREFIH
jgi:hypothetical protein